MNLKCFIDGSEADFLLGKDGYDHYVCSNCGLVFVYPLPSEEVLKQDVYSEASGYQAGKTTDDGSLTHSRHTKRILEYLNAEVRPPEYPRTDLEGRKLLDVGCSSGDFLVAVRELGFNVTGVELNPRTARQALSRGLDVRVGMLTDAEFRASSFNFIHLGDVIEHVRDPRALLYECARLLVPGGELIISTPNIGSFWSRATLGLWRSFGIPWSSATPPHHLFLFGKDNLGTLALQEGFRKKAGWYECPPRLMYELGNLHLWGKWRRERTLKNLIVLIYSFSLYASLYGLNFILTPFLRQNFGRVHIYVKST